VFGGKEAQILRVLSAILTFASARKSNPNKEQIRSFSEQKNALLRKLYQRSYTGIGDKSEQEFPVGHHTLGANGLSKLDRQAELDSHSGILEIGRDVLTHDAHIVGIVHMMVIVDIVSGDLIRLVRREFAFGDVYAAVQVFHVELLFERHRVHDILRNTRQLPRLPVDKRPHAPRLVARFALCIVNKRIAKSEHRFHAIDGGHHLQVFAILRHPNNIHLSGCKQLGAMLLPEKFFHSRLARYP